jgi:U3 small nucleolar RNA-associated protein 22
LDINDDEASVGDDSNDLMHEEDQREDEWRGISGEQAAAEATTYEHRTGTKPKKPPTGHELRAIKDATDLFKSSSFKLQV